MEKMTVEVELKAEYIIANKKYAPTGEYRVPAIGEAIIDSFGTPQIVIGPLEANYFMLKEVEPTKEKLTFNQLVDMAKDGYGFIDPWGNLKYLPEITLSTEHKVYIGEHEASGFKYIKPYCLDLSKAAVEFEVDLSTTFYPF